MISEIICVQQRSELSITTAACKVMCLHSPQRAPMSYDVGFSVSVSRSCQATGPVVRYTVYWDELEISRRSHVLYKLWGVQSCGATKQDMRENSLNAVWTAPSVWQLRGKRTAADARWKTHAWHVFPLSHALNSSEVCWRASRVWSCCHGWSMVHTPNHSTTIVTVYSAAVVDEDYWSLQFVKLESLKIRGHAALSQKIGLYSTKLSTNLIEGTCKTASMESDWCNYISM